MSLVFNLSIKSSVILGLLLCSTLILCVCMNLWSRSLIIVGIVGIWWMERFCLLCQELDFIFFQKKKKRNCFVSLLFLLFHFPFSCLEYWVLIYFFFTTAGGWRQSLVGFVYCVGIVNIHFKLTILNKARLGLVVDVMCITLLFWVRILLLPFVVCFRFN